MSIRNDQHIYVTQTEKLERLQQSHDELLAAAKEMLPLITLIELPTPSMKIVFNKLRAAIAKTEKTT